MATVNRNRAAGEGSVYQRADGRWVAQFTYQDAAGKTRRQFRYVKSKPDAWKALAAMQRKHIAGQPIATERHTVKSYLELWLAGREPDMKPESFRRYRDHVNLHLIPAIGGTKLSKLTGAQLRAAYASLRTETRLSGTTVQQVHGVLHKALEDAMKWEIVSRNVADMVDAPRRTTPEMRTITREDAASLLAAAKGDPLEALYVLALTCGLRLGELQALRWKDVDLHRRRLSVTGTLAGVVPRRKDRAEPAPGEPVPGTPIITEPKTQRSRRVVQLSDMAAAALSQHRLDQLRQKHKAGSLWTEHGLVFANGFGRALDGNNIRERSFSLLLERAGLSHMRFHDLRHGAATLLMAEGVAVKVIGEMLGHADITTTLRIYAHVLPAMQDEAAKAMDRLFGASKLSEPQGARET